MNNGSVPALPDSTPTPPPPHPTATEAVVDPGTPGAPPPAQPEEGVPGAAPPPLPPVVGGPTTTVHTPAGAPPYPSQPAVPPKEKRVYTNPERWLLLIALLAGILYDRIVTAGSIFEFPLRSAAFSLCYLVIFYGVNWKKLRGNPILWMVAAFTTALCVWNFLHDGNSAYGIITCMVIPGVLMAHAQFLSGAYRLKAVAVIVGAWFAGWFIRPFSAIHHFVGAAQSAMETGRRAVLKKVFAGIGISLLLLVVILPLLASADLVFGHYLGRIFRSFHMGRLIGHLTIVLIAWLLFYSFFWNSRFAVPTGAKERKRAQMDLIVACIVLSVVVVVYLLFCGVQFTYLFARAGLPGEMTYAEYAREGFGQLIAVAALNLLLFGIFLHYAPRHPVLLVLLGLLLGTTGLMVVSSFMRLELYISTFGLTWLRILSMWFQMYLAVVLILCGVRMVKERLPVIAICSFVLLGWYTVLGYVNPDALIVRYNLAYSPDPASWVEKNTYYLKYTLSDDGILALAESDAEGAAVEEIIQYRLERAQNSASSLSSWRLRRLAKEG